MAFIFFWIPPIVSSSSLYDAFVLVSIGGNLGAGAEAPAPLFECEPISDFREPAMLIYFALSVGKPPALITAKNSFLGKVAIFTTASPEGKDIPVFNPSPLPIGADGVDVGPVDC
jgi:hypothetical protein